MPILRSKTAAALTERPKTEAQSSTRGLQPRLNAQDQVAVLETITKVKAFQQSSSKKRARSATSAAQSVNAPIAKLEPVKKSKPRKALLSTLWTAEELVPLKAKADQLYEQLNQLYIDPPCPLDYSTPFQLLVSVILSAQVCG